MTSREEICALKNDVILMQDGYVESSKLMSIIIGAQEPIDLLEWQRRLVALCDYLASTREIQAVCRTKSPSRAAALTEMFMLEADGWPEDFQDVMDELGLEIADPRDMSKAVFINNYTAFLLSDQYNADEYEIEGWFEAHIPNGKGGELHITRDDFEKFDFDFKAENEKLIEDLEARFRPKKTISEKYSDMKRVLKNAGYSEEDIDVALKCPGEESADEEDDE